MGVSRLDWSQHIRKHLYKDLGKWKLLFPYVWVIPRKWKFVWLTWEYWKSKWQLVDERRDQRGLSSTQIFLKLSPTFRWRQHCHYLKNLRPTLASEDHTIKLDQITIHTNHFSLTHRQLKWNFPTSYKVKTLFILDDSSFFFFFVYHDATLWKRHTNRIWH